MTYEIATFPTTSKFLFKIGYFSRSCCIKIKTILPSHRITRLLGFCLLYLVYADFLYLLNKLTLLGSQEI